MNICGHEYKVCFVPSNNKKIIDGDGDVAFGKQNSLKAEICINSDCSESMQEETLIHEIIHCALCHLNDPNEHDEGVINAIANALFRLGVGKFIIDTHINKG